MNKKQKQIIKTLIIVVSMAAFLSLAMILVVNKKKPQTTNTANTNQTQNTTENEKEIDTSDWITYTNPTYGYSFKYPEISRDRLICPDDYDQSVPMESLSTNENEWVTLLDCRGPIFSVIVSNPTRYYDYQEVIDNWDKIIFNGYPSYIGNDSHTKIIVIEKGDNLYILRSSTENNLEDSQIISTFRFQ